MYACACVCHGECSLFIVVASSRRQRLSAGNSCPSPTDKIFQHKKRFTISGTSGVLLIPPHSPSSCRCRCFRTTDQVIKQAFVRGRAETTKKGQMNCQASLFLFPSPPISMVLLSLLLFWFCQWEDKNVGENKTITVRYTTNKLIQQLRRSHLPFPSPTPAMN
ncbi:hypothetical protein BX666DRAFT_981544 [Dichotomocladium elegans]|nr:hypothetical protein BX666DRAFT_981544 [Dichotomocladium elegans]